MSERAKQGRVSERAREGEREGGRQGEASEMEGGRGERERGDNSETREE